jgi:hypothetical protein
MTDQWDVPVGPALKFPVVLLNIANAFNASTGEFTAPYNATYFFLASSVDNKIGRSTCMALMVDNDELDSVLTNGEATWIPATVQGTARMRQGQKAWVKGTYILNFFAGEYTAFSGFLISHTP